MHGIGKRATSALEGFRAFILRGNLLDLAIGIVIGAAFSAVVNSLMSSIIKPLIHLPGHSLAGLKWQVPYARPGVFVNLGAFISALISFVIVALVIYFFVVRPLTALLARYAPQYNIEVQDKRDCPFCLQSIPVKARRCAFCTSEVPSLG